MEVVVGQEREFDRRHRTLDRHFRDVDDQTTLVHRIERALHRQRPFKGVKGVHAVVHGLLHAVDLLRGDAAPQRTDQPVIGQISRGRLYPAALVIDELDVCVEQADIVGQGVGDTLDDIVCALVAVEPKRQKEQSRLIDVRPGSVDDGDRPLLQIEAVRQHVRRQGAARARTENHHILHLLTPEKATPPWPWDERESPPAARPAGSTG